MGAEEAVPRQRPQRPRRQHRLPRRPRHRAGPGDVGVHDQLWRQRRSRGRATGSVGFLAPTQTATLTAAEANYAGSFTAGVELRAGDGRAGDLGDRGLHPHGRRCDPLRRAARSRLPASPPRPRRPSHSTVANTPGGVVLRWYTPNYQTQSPPLPQAGSPINIVGTGAVFAPILAISEQNYIGGFPAANVTAAAACTGFATIVANATVPTGLPTAAPGTSLVYYTVTGVAGITQPAAACTITAKDCTCRLHQRRQIRTRRSRSVLRPARGVSNELPSANDTLRAIAALAVARSALALAGCGGGGSSAPSVSPLPASQTGVQSTRPVVTILGVLAGCLTVDTPEHDRRDVLDAVEPCSARRQPTYIDTTTANSALVASVTPLNPAAAAQYGTLGGLLQPLHERCAGPGHEWELRHDPDRRSAHQRNDRDPDAPRYGRLPDHAVRRSVRHAGPFGAPTAPPGNIR